jgi:DNA-binding transcriptional LysR family regulator
MYDLRRLRAFHEVAERRSFSAAALELGYAQSVVSHHIAALEAEFGLTLVDRGLRPVRLTPAGERLRGHVIEVLRRVTEAEDEMRALAGLHSGTLRLAAFQTAWTSFVPPALANFERQHPGIQISVEQAERDEALRRVRAGDIDIAVVFFQRPTPPPTDGHDGLAWRHLGNDPFRLVLPADHRLARRRRLKISDLATERFAAPPPEGQGLLYHEMLNDVCAQGDFKPNVAYTVRDVTVGRALVAAGLAISIMAELTLPPPRSDVAVRPLPGTRQPHWTIFAVWLHNRRAPAVAPMVNLLTKTAATACGTHQ